jgi:iron(III) transport system permease protein
MAAFAHNGWLHGLLQTVGIDEVPDVYSLWGVVLALTWAYPLALLQIQAALSRTDPALWGAARTLGAGPWRAFRDVVLPAVRAPMATGGLLVGLYAVGDFGAVSLLRFESLSYIVYLRHKSLFARAEVVPLSLLLAVVALILVAVVIVIGGRTARGGRTINAHRAWPTIRLGRWRWFAFAYCAGLVLFFVGLPVGVVGYWLARGLQLGADLHVPWDDATHSAVLGAVSALILTLAAIGPALAHRFGRVSGARVLRALTFVGYALPGIVVALSMVSFVVRWVEPLYQTFGLLVFAYVIRFTPLALGSLDDGLQRVGDGLLDAARTLGATRTKATMTVILPSAAPAIAAAFLGVFIAVAKELPAALILGPLEYDTLSTRIWTLTEDAFYALASIPILMMLAVALVGLLAGRRLTR